MPVPEVIALIPCYNNGGTVRAVAAGCRAVLDTVVVDDGSTDVDVAALLADRDVTVVRHPENRGKGAAIVTGLALAAERGADYLLTIDADGQHRPEDIPAMVAALPADGTPTVVLGNRRMGGANVPGRSRFGQAFSNFWVRLETGLSLPDTQSGFRVYPVAPLRELGFCTRHYDFEIEVLVRLAWGGVPVVSVPVDCHYPPPAERVSSFRPFRDNLRLSLLHSRLIGRRLVPWPHRRLVPRPPATSPREFLRHPGRFIRALLTEHATPAGLGVAAAIGMLLGVLPLISCHTVVTIYVAARLNLNKPMAVGVQQLCMPPVVPVMCIELGHWLLYREWILEPSWQAFALELHKRLFEWLLGSLILAPVFAVVAGVVVAVVSRTIQQRGTADVAAP